MSADRKLSWPDQKTSRRLFVAKAAMGLGALTFVGGAGLQFYAKTRAESDADEAFPPTLNRAATEQAQGQLAIAKQEFNTAIIELGDSDKTVSARKKIISLAQSDEIFAASSTLELDRKKKQFISDRAGVYGATMATVAEYAGLATAATGFYAGISAIEDNRTSSPTLVKGNGAPSPV